MLRALRSEGDLLRLFLVEGDARGRRRGIHLGVLGHVVVQELVGVRVLQVLAAELPRLLRDVAGELDVAPVLLPRLELLGALDLGLPLLGKDVLVAGPGVELPRQAVEQHPVLALDAEQGYGVTFLAAEPVEHAHDALRLPRRQFGVEDDLQAGADAAVAPRLQRALILRRLHRDEVRRGLRVLALVALLVVVGEAEDAVVEQGGVDQLAHVRLPVVLTVDQRVRVQDALLVELADPRDREAGGVRGVREDEPVGFVVEGDRRRAVQADRLHRQRHQAADARARAHHRLAVVGFHQRAVHVDVVVEVLDAVQVEADRVQQVLPHRRAVVEDRRVVAAGDVVHVPVGRGVVVDGVRVLRIEALQLGRHVHERVDRVEQPVRSPLVELVDGGAADAGQHVRHVAGRDDQLELLPERLVRHQPGLDVQVEPVQDDLVQAARAEVADPERVLALQQRDGNHLVGCRGGRLLGAAFRPGDGAERGQQRNAHRAMRSRFISLSFSVDDSPKLGVCAALSPTPSGSRAAHP